MDMAAGLGSTNAALNLSLSSASYMPQAALLLATNSTQQHSPNSHQQTPTVQVVDYASSPMHRQGKTDVKVEVEGECGIKQQQQTKTRKMPKRYEKLEGYIRAPRGKVPNEEWLANYSIMHLVNAGLIKRHHKNSCFCRVCTDGQQEEPILWEWQPAPPKKKHKQQQQQQESWRGAKKKAKLMTVEQQQQQHHILQGQPQHLVQLQQMQQMPQQQQLHMQPAQFVQQPQQHHHYPQQQQATIVKTETVVKTEIETVVDSVFSKVVKGVDGSHGQSQVVPQQQLQPQQGTALLAGAPFIYHPSPTYGIYSQTQAILDQANYHPTAAAAAQPQAAVYQPFFIAAAPQGPHAQFAHLQQQPSKPPSQQQQQQHQQTSFAAINDPRFL